VRELLLGQFFTFVIFFYLVILSEGSALACEHALAVERPDVCMENLLRTIDELSASRSLDYERQSASG
jgi:hypothetical protein